MTIYQEDEAHELYDKDPTDDIEWYYTQKTISVVLTCDACNHKTECTVFSNMNDDFVNEYAWFCKVCACTLSGNAYWYPDYYKKDILVLRHIAACTNLILDEIKNLPENFGLFKVT